MSRYQSISFPDIVVFLFIVQNGSKVVCGSQDGILSIYSWGKWADLSDRFPGHPESIETMVPLSEDVILTGSSDGLIRSHSWLMFRPSSCSVSSTSTRIHFWELSDSTKTSRSRNFAYLEMATYSRVFPTISPSNFGILVDRILLSLSILLTSNRFLLWTSWWDGRKGWKACNCYQGGHGANRRRSRKERNARFLLGPHVNYFVVKQLIYYDWNQRVLEVSH